MRNFFKITSNRPNTPKTPTQAKSVARDWAEQIIIALILALFIRTFIVQAFKIPTGSMRMTLIEGDRILVNKLRYGAEVPFVGIRLPAFRQPQRGDVVVFRYPEDPKKDFIKRLVALPGETLEIRNGSIYINGILNKDQFIHNRYYYNRPESDFGKEGQIIKVPESSFYVLGDNSSSSRDSRYWGFVPKKNVLGKAMVVYWPPNRIRVIR